MDVSIGLRLLTCNYIHSTLIYDINGHGTAIFSNIFVVNLFQSFALVVFVTLTITNILGQTCNRKQRELHETKGLYR